MNASRISSASRPRTPTEMDDQPPSKINEPRTSTDLGDELHQRFLKRHGSWTTESDDDTIEHLASTSVNSAYVSIVGPGGGESSDNSSDSSGFRLSDQEKLRRKLAFFFMDPVTKFIARRQAPWKLLIQFLKIILVTLQLVIFGNFRYAHTNYYADNEIGFEHLFLKDWDSVREVNSYPPTTGTYALYMKSTFYGLFNNTADTYFHLEENAINPIFRNSTLDFCVESFIPDNEIFKVPTYDKGYEKFRTKFSCISIPTKNLDNLDSQAYLEDVGFDVPWDVLEKMHINFTVRTITYRQMGPLVGPACFTFDIMITFDNSDHDGQIIIRLDTEPRRVSCPEGIKAVATTSAVGIRILDYVIIINCVVSFFLCTRALFRAQILCVETREFFKLNKSSDLCPGERFQFLNLWYIVICVNDILIITGSVLKELIEMRQTTGDLWNFCSVFLGSGSLLVWMGMLRYLGFFDTYNVLILTLKGALPNVVRFMICAGIVYLGYTFCGWVVLGPYHYKFKTLESTSECLFSLINGDDMFATFSMISNKAPMIHGFSRLYLYSFVILFIYVILSLFIAIIMDTYEVIKEYYKKGFPKSRVDEFYTAGKYDHYSEIFFDGSSPSLMYKAWASVMMSFYGDSWRGWRREKKYQQLHRQQQQQEQAEDATPILT